MSKVDRRVQRTTLSLQQAMIELILEQGFESITVSEITERANVGRSTFYAHYADKEDLLQGSIEGLRGHLQAQMDISRDGDYDGHPALAFCLPMLEHALEVTELFTALFGLNSGHLVHELVHDVWANLVRDAVPELDELTVQAVVGGFSSTLKWWHDKGSHLTPAEVDQRFRAIFEPALWAGQNAGLAT